MGSITKFGNFETRPVIMSKIDENANFLYIKSFKIISHKKAGGKKKKASNTADKTDGEPKEIKGQENKAYDAEKGPDAGEKKEEDKWVKNYVPYDEYPAGKADTISVENEGEQKRRVDEKGEKESEEKWKENYVPYEEKSEN